MGKAISILAVCVTMAGIAVCFSVPRPLPGWLQGKEMIALSKWQSHDYPEADYVGTATCARCHADKASQSGTPMAHALEQIGECRVLLTHRELTFRNGPYTYRIVRQGNSSIYSVSGGGKTISEPILYPFGLGKVGQTYIFRHNGRLFESKVTYYESLQGLDFTGGQLRAAPATVEQALGRPLGPDDAQGCFGCHAPLNVTREGLRLTQLKPGIGCEACHGPGGEHVAGVEAAGSQDTRVFNPGRLDARTLSQEFCGSCHRGYDQVMVMPGQGGLNNLRFQPYRIYNSRGHNGPDRRIGCVACHDVHGELQHAAAYYDSRCIACHGEGALRVGEGTRPAGVCPVGKNECTRCHMPKIEVPEMHFKFTDHWIRVVRAGEPVPR